MRAILFERYGAPDVLHLAEVSMPEPGPGQVRVRVAAIGVNPADVKWRQGMFRDSVPLHLPHVVGYDVAGTIDAIGPGVAFFNIQDRVVASVRSAYAEFAIADEKACARLPEGFGFTAAAALPCAALTGVQMIEEGISPGDAQTVLITGATGAVGRFAMHAALAMGVRVVAAVRPSYFEEARQLGAHHVIGLDDYDGANLMFDHVADTVGGSGVAKRCRQLAPGGSIFTVSTNPIEPAGLSTIPIFFAYHTDGPRLRQIVDGAAAGGMTMPIAHRLPFASAQEAHRLVERGGLRGKIVLELSAG